MSDLRDGYGFVCWRTLGDSRILAVTALTYGRARLTIGTGFDHYDDGW